MTVKVAERREIRAEAPETPLFGECPHPDEATVTFYVRIICEPPPEPYLGRPVVRQLPADWPYPPEEGYDD